MRERERERAREKELDEGWVIPKQVTIWPHHFPPACDTTKYDCGMFLPSPVQMALGKIHNQHSLLLASAVESIQSSDPPNKFIYHLLTFDQLLSI